jgi:cell division cycle protein 20 (cofactor of APC complex)
LTCSSIWFCLVKDQKHAFLEQNSAKELWQALENKLMKKSIENHLYLTKRIFHLKYKKGTFMSDHLNNFNKMIVDLKILIVEINDEDKALHCYWIPCLRHMNISSPLYYMVNKRLNLLTYLMLWWIMNIGRRSKLFTRSQL